MARKARITAQERRWYATYAKLKAADKKRRKALLEVDKWAEKLRLIQEKLDKMTL